MFKWFSTIFSLGAPVSCPHYLPLGLRGCEICCTYILRWKNEKRVKEQSLLSKGEMPCRVKLIESRRGKWGVNG